MALFKKGSIWWMDFVCEGRRFRRSTKTEDVKLARRIHDKVKGQVAEKKWFESFPGEDKTFREMMEKYLLEYASKKASARSFIGYAKKPISVLGDYLLPSITPKTINQYKTTRVTDGVKPATINRELATMKKAFNLAIKEWEWIRDNPVSKVSMEQENNRRERWLTDTEEERLMEACSDWLRELVVFALNTGMRISEILSLEWRRVDLFRKMVTLLDVKNKTPRSIPINETIFEMLKKKFKVKSILTDLVFYNTETHAMFHKTSADHAFRVATAKAGIENFRFHDLRHTAATRMVQDGADIYQVQVILGHKSPVMTQRYAHHSVESLRNAVARLDRYGTFLPPQEEKQVSQGL